MGDLEADRAEGLRILEVCIVGVQADTAEALRRVMHLRAESKLTAEDLREDLTAIYASRKVETIEAAAKSASGGTAILILTAKERPRIAAVKLEGFTGAARGAPADAFGKVGELLDLHHVAAAEQKVTDAFVEDGWEEARVTHDVKLGPDGRATLTVSLVQGARTKVGKVSFLGARPELVAGLRKVVDLDEGSPLVTDRLERAALRVTEFYYDRGFVDARQEMPEKVRATDGTAAITFKIKEGASDVDRPRALLRSSASLHVREMHAAARDPLPAGLPPGRLGVRLQAGRSARRDLSSRVISAASGARRKSSRHVRQVVDPSVLAA